MRTPKVVGTAEAAEILGVIVPSITRRKKAGQMPDPAVELAATTVWHTTDVERLAKGGKLNGQVKPLDLLGTSEAAKLLEVDKSQIGRWRRAGKFPSPCKELTAGPLWWREQIEAFSDGR